MATVLAMTASADGAGAQFLGRSKPAPQPVVIPTLQPPQLGYVFPTKQTLTFTVDWRVFTAGIAKFNLEQDGTQMKIVADASTIGAVSMLFQVMDQFSSSFDTKTGCSGGFDKHLVEGRRKIQQPVEVRLRNRQADADGDEPYQRDDTESDGIDSGVRDGLAVGDLLCCFAADGGGAEDWVSAGGFDADGDCADEGGGEGGDQDSGRHFSDDPRGTYGG